MNIVNGVVKCSTEEFVVVYLDVILMHEKSWEEHPRHPKLVVNQFREHELYAKLLKCKFGV